MLHRAQLRLDDWTREQLGRQGYALQEIDLPAQSKVLTVQPLDGWLVLFYLETQEPPSLAVMPDFVPGARKRTYLLFVRADSDGAGHPGMNRGQFLGYVSHLLVWFLA